MSRKKKVGVLLIQLGTPDSEKKADVKNYLTEFLNDPRVIDKPKGFKRKALVNGVIIPARIKNSTQIYRELWEHGEGESPLLVYSEKQRKLLQERFTTNENSTVSVYLAMRYRKPSMEHVLEKMRKENFDKIIFVPLFPHYASATIGTAVEKAASILSKWWVIPEVSTVPDYFDNEAYIDTYVDNAKQFSLNEFDKVLFSYHGLPERHVSKVHTNGDCKTHNCESEINENNRFCYKAQCFATTRAIATKLGLKEEDYTVGFQSRLDKDWLSPFSDRVIDNWAKEGAKKVAVFSPAFVADCLETIIEIGVEYNEDFRKAGGELVQLIPSANEHPRFIDCLEGLVRERL